MVNATRTLTRRKALLLGLTTVTGAALAACSAMPAAPAAKTASAPASAKPRTIRVGTFRQNHVAAPLFWPKFAPSGTTVEVSTFGSGTDMNRLLDTGELDFAAFGTVNGFIEVEQGLRSKIIGMVARQGAGVMVKRDGPLNAPADLKGKKIGIKAPSFQYLVMIRQLRDLGLDPNKDVTLVPVEWTDMPLALEKGDVDAYMGSEPAPSRSVVAGAGRRLVNPYTTEVGSLNSALWMSHTVPGKDADLPRIAIDMQRSAADFLSPSGTNDPEAWRDLIVNQFGLPDDVFRELLTNVGAVWRLDDFWIKQAHAQGDEMLRLGLLKEKPKYESVIDPQYQPKS